MSYVMIRNPGVADHRCFTLLGVSTTRNAELSGTIGQFGSGIKHAIALLLRRGIRTTIIPGNLRMDFSCKEEYIGGDQFHRICIKYSGEDPTTGKSINRIKELDAVTEWSAHDWTKTSMAMREIVSNAIDGSIAMGGTYADVELEMVDKPRAKAGYTAVFLPVSDEVEKLVRELGKFFLHFQDAKLLKEKFLPKQNLGTDRVLIYKKGVLVCHCRGKSVYDYNLGDELELDESRNASEWDVKYSVANALRDQSADVLAPLIKAATESPDGFETNLDSCYVTQGSYGSAEIKENRAKQFQEAWARVAGPKGVVTTGKVNLSSFIQEKGYTPVLVHGNWGKILEAYGVLSEGKVLTRNELQGKTLSPATPEMLNCTAKVWSLLESFNRTKGKKCPSVQGFDSVMDGGSQILGYYVPGEDCIYLHTSLGAGKMMFATALEEVVHYVTGSDDKSRDIQDFLFNLVTDMAY